MEEEKNTTGAEGFEQRRRGREMEKGRKLEDRRINDGSRGEREVGGENRGGANGKRRIRRRN